MKKKSQVFGILITFGIFLFLMLILQVVEIAVFGKEIAMLFPKGWIALRERNLLFIVQALMLIVVLPVFFMFFYFTWKYRATNTKANYTPDWDHSTISEVVWWGVPFILVIIISFLTWYETHNLDPYKPIENGKKTLNIQVIALQWKWLFLYPEQNIATLNYFNIPEKTPVRFEITSDAPMNSFWIPNLAGQIYAMPKMKTTLWAIADETGRSRGSSANISGIGFADMHFMTNALSESDFEKWVQKAKSSTTSLTSDYYNTLAKPGVIPEEQTYVLQAPNLFEEVVMKFMMPPQQMEKMENKP